VTLQPSLFEEPEAPTSKPPAHRVRALAEILAGFSWPGAGSYAKLTAKQRDLAERTAGEALATLTRE
jgi:hypothetical protein